MQALLVVLSDIRGKVLVVLIFADNKTRGNHWDVKFVWQHSKISSWKIRISFVPLNTVGWI